MKSPRSIFTGASIFTLLATAAPVPALQKRQTRAGPPSLAEIAVPDDTDFCAYFDALDAHTGFHRVVRSEALAAFMRHAAIDALEAGVAGDAIIEGEFVEIDVEDDDTPVFAESVCAARARAMKAARDVYAALRDTAPAY